MDKELEERLKYLKLPDLFANWDETMATAKAKNPSYPGFTKSIIDKEYSVKKERARLLRLKRAQIEDPFVIETYPFDKQPNLSKKKILDLFDSKTYLSKKQNLVFIGPTGAGKTGISTSLLIHAINLGYTGRFVTFPDLLHELYGSVADHSEKKVLGRFMKYECLVIDELGYVDIDPNQAGLFFTLMKHRHKRSTTMITTQLGFKEWTAFLKNQHMAAALIDRLTENCQVLNLGKCTSIRETTPTETK